MKENNKDTGTLIWYETKDMLAGAAFPIMLQMITSVTFIGMTAAFNSSDLALAIVMLCIGELLMGIAYAIFGRMSGITSVRRIIQHAKKCDVGTDDKQAILCTGEYSAYKGFVMGAISCVPYIIFQIIQCAAPNVFCEFVLRYVFGWAALPLTLGQNSVSPWLNLLFVVYPVVVHGIAYIVGAHKEWNKQQKVAEMQTGGGDNK